ncbi:RluA family pseudouridine synthase [Paenibacillus polysaccharolyticus]|uniref:RluA family pseudouridine synthase n=1 Tax=Paenibacillus polysaccharolyticus TaxID=582692 RepID=UPI00204153CB|nr:RluA family pseudouridine synthase [Paenibacillus polysaccharolyticus]MCM3131196.1 RluA family pseudouridine synthase [Paenibacillus polysaccharolyticus]
MNKRKRSTGGTSAKGKSYGGSSKPRSGRYNTSSSKPNSPRSGEDTSKVSASHSSVAPAKNGGKGSKPAKPATASKRPGNAHYRKSEPPRQYKVTEPDELLNFLLKHVKSGRNAVKSILGRGQVSIDEKVVTKFNEPLLPGQIVSISKEGAVAAPSLTGINILHEDDDIIVIRKEAGLLSIAADKSDDLTAYRQLMSHVRRTNELNRIFIVHRLDRDTSGVMMFAKSEEVQQQLQNNWKENVQDRVYVALVEGAVAQEEGTISSWLKETKTLKMYSSSRPNDGQHAVTHYKRLKSNREFSLLEVRLETGRKNQIRVHMEDLGHPIAGDRKYGARTRDLGRLGLHARVLSFIHPTTGKLMTFETDIPKPFLYPFRGEATPAQ